MSEKEFNEIFSERLKYYMDRYEMTQVELAKRLGVSTSTTYYWLNGIKTPRMDKVDEMCRIFHCKRSDLTAEGYYTDGDTAEIAQEIFDNHDLRVLFDAARDASPEDLKTTYNMLMALKKKGSDQDD
ncbi:MAG: helix-turn-helix domain-containing protein [Bacteroidales bacterium]|nr:helix-turn-helix domain-containing protein [Bacteroidales bacterium]